MAAVGKGGGRGGYVCEIIHAVYCNAKSSALPVRSHVPAQSRASAARDMALQGFRGGDSLALQRPSMFCFHTLQPNITTEARKWVAKAVQLAEKRSAHRQNAKRQMASANKPEVRSRGRAEEGEAHKLKTKGV